MEEVVTSIEIPRWVSSKSRMPPGNGGVDMLPGSSIVSVETTLEKGDKWVNNETVDYHQGTHVEGQALGTSRGALAQV